MSERLIQELNHTIRTADHQGDAALSHACRQVLDLFNKPKMPMVGGCKPRPQVDRVLDQTSIVVFEWQADLKQPTRYVSSTIGQFGYSPEDFYTGCFKDYYAFIHEEDRQGVKTRIDQARKEGLAELQHHYRVTGASGTTHWVEERLSMTRDSQGQVVSERGVLLDITNHKVKEIRLEETKSKYQRLYEHAAVMMFTCSPQGRILSANKKCRQVFMLSDSLVQDLDIVNLLHGDSKKAWTSGVLQKQVKTWSTKDHELDILDGGGQVKTLSVRLSPVYKEGQVVELEGIAYDITHKVKRDKELHYYTYHDALTGLYNRAFIDARLTELEQTASYPYTIIVGDMNGLKDVNDLLGHDSGDALLMEMAQILKTSCRETDYIARYGGDEFLVLLPGSDESVAERVMMAIRKKTKNRDQAMTKPSIALGAASKHGPSPSGESLFLKADDAMYRDKLSSERHRQSKIDEKLEKAVKRLPQHTRDRSSRLVKLVPPMGKALGINKGVIADLKLAIQFHDIGQIALPYTLFTKKGKLKGEEYALIKEHPEIGARILQKYHVNDRVASAVRHHHEWFDGSGYPAGLAGEDIPVASRIIAVLEAYDAMIQPCIYKPKVSPEKALEELMHFADIQFDKKVVLALEGLIKVQAKVKETGKTTKTI